MSVEGSHSAEVELVVLIAAAFGAARVLYGLPPLVAGLVLVGGVASIRPRVVVAGLMLLIACHAGHDLNSLTPSATGTLDAVDVELVSDPKPSTGRVIAQAVIDGDRVLLSAQSAQAGQLRTASTGDRVVVSGTLRGSSPTTSWAISRRLVGTVNATDVTMGATATGPTGVANRFRDVLRRGVSHLAPDRQVLFSGLVYGDDRGQSVIVADNFRAAGLGHLLAVSGQNVVFVLLLAAPVIGRLRLAATRVGLSVGVLVAFGFLTRFEPSVSRALVMAGLALLAHAVGRPAAALRVLPPAVIGLLLFDPLLAWSLAFQLSVAATVGLVVLSPRIADRIGGPRPVAMAVAATVGAQLAVAPLLVITFGTLSLVAVPANLLAGPAAAAVMMWGLVAGALAGLAPPIVAELLHMPTQVLLWWLDAVADVFSRAAVGHVGGVHLVVAASCAAALVAAGGRKASPTATLAWRSALTVLLCATVIVPVVTPKPLSAGRHRLAAGVEVVRSANGHDIVIIGTRAQGDETIRTLRQSRLGRIDLVIASHGSRSVGRVIRLVQQRFDVHETWAPDGHQVPGARTVDPLEGRLANLEISVAASGEILITERS